MCIYAFQHSFLAKMTIWQSVWCRKAYGRIAGFQSSRNWRDGDETYAGMVEVSRALMKVSHPVKGPKCPTRCPSLCRAMRATASSLLSVRTDALVWLLPSDSGNDLSIVTNDQRLIRMQGRSAMKQRQAVIQGFPRVPQWFRKLFPYSRWGAELNARITPAFFTWLVGPMQSKEALADNGVVQQSGVRIECCR